MTVAPVRISATRDLGLIASWPRRRAAGAAAMLAIPSDSNRFCRHAIGLRRLPAGDGADALPRLGVVGDAREPPAQLDRSRELATLLKDGTDCGSICLGDDEHRWSMGRRVEADKRHALMWIITRAHDGRYSRAWLSSRNISPARKRPRQGTTRS
jgi:hypothetical protein